MTSTPYLGASIARSVAALVFPSFIFLVIKTKCDEQVLSIQPRSISFRFCNAP